MFVVFGLNYEHLLFVYSFAWLELRKYSVYDYGACPTILEYMDKRWVWMCHIYGVYFNLTEVDSFVHMKRRPLLYITSILSVIVIF